MRCENCAHFDEDDTSLPVCTLHKRFMHKEWTCGDAKARNQTSTPVDEKTINTAKASDEFGGVNG